MRQLRIAFLLTLVFVACGTRGWAQLKVSPSGPPMGDGSSWMNPLPAYLLQQKIDEGVTEIWLKQGEYPLLRLRAGTNIKGGYHGDPFLEALGIEERDPKMYPSAISGVRVGPYEMLPDGSIQDNPTIDPNKPGLKIPANVQMDGCTLLPSYSGTTPASGECIFSFGAKDYPTFTNCVLQGSGSGSQEIGAVAAGGFLYDGGITVASVRLVDCEIKDMGRFGAFAVTYGSLDLARCKITKCRLGIAVLSSHIQELPPKQMQLTMADCLVQDNGAGAKQDGLWNGNVHWGGAEISGGAKALISRCEFSDNTGYGSAGGLSLIGTDNSRVAVRECTITRNTGVGGAAGGVDCAWDSYNGFAKVHADAPDAFAFTDCTISDNVAKADGLTPYFQAFTGGAGIRTQTAGVQMTRCAIVGNHSEMVGGGVYVGRSGETYLAGDYGPPVTLRSCLIAHNTADGRGGGVYLSASDPRILNCTIADNSSPLGGAVYAYAVQASAYTELLQPALFANCALTGNTSSLGTVLLHDGVFINGYYPHYNGPYPPPVFKRCVYAASDTWLQHYTRLPAPTKAVPPPPSDGNILVAAPKYVNPAGGDYHLLSDSPLIDRGDNVFTLPGDKDMDGLARVIGAFTDIGAYEQRIGPPNIIVDLASGVKGDPIQLTLRLKNIGGAAAANFQITSITAFDAANKPYVVQSTQYTLSDPAGALRVGEKLQVRISLKPTGSPIPFARLRILGVYVNGNFALNSYLNF